MQTSGVPYVEIRLGELKDAREQLLMAGVVSGDNPGTWTYETASAFGEDGKWYAVCAIDRFDMRSTTIQKRNSLCPALCKLPPNRSIAIQHRLGCNPHED